MTKRWTAIVLCACCLQAAAHAETAGNASANGEEEAHQGEGHRDRHDHHDEIVVTITGQDRQQFDVIQGSSVLAGDELQRNQGASLGERHLPARCRRYNST